MDTNIKYAEASEKTIRLAVEEIAREAGEIALTYFHSLENIPIEEKGHLDLVTKADREVEEFLINGLHKKFPSDGIYGEEGGDITGTSGRTWVVDPIDGTFNFVRGNQNWAVSIGLYEDHQPVFGVIYAPVYGLMIAGGENSVACINGKPIKPLPPFNLSRASIGIGMHPSIPTSDRLEMIRYISDELGVVFRCCGASTISLIEVATGQTDGYLSLGESTWDVMAGFAIFKNLGLSHTIDWNNTNLQDKLCYACGSEEFLIKVRPFLRNIGVITAVKEE